MKQGTSRCFKEGRLVYYRKVADEAFWEQHWKKNFSADTYNLAEQGVLGELEEPFDKWLPKHGCILEAGCGLGQVLLALRMRGYYVEGMEWASATVELVRRWRPDLPIRTGDVKRLDVPNGHYQGYISLGVIEHHQEGPEPFLKEAYRVLADDGILLISVPYIHPLRRAKARLGLYRGRANGLEFYQYAFSAEEMYDILRRMGFTTVETYAYSSFKGIKDEIPILRRLLELRGIDWRLQRLLQSWKWVERYLGHMILFVCRKAL